MHSTLILILFVGAVLLLLLFAYKLKDLRDLRLRVYDLISFSRMGNPSKEDICRMLKECAHAPAFTSLGVSFVLFLLRFQGSIATSILRVTHGTQLTLITVYAPRSIKRQSSLRKRRMLGM